MNNLSVTKEEELPISLWQLALDKVQDAVFVVDEVGGLVYTNQRALELISGNSVDYATQRFKLPFENRVSKECLLLTAEHILMDSGLQMFEQECQLQTGQNQSISVKLNTTSLFADTDAMLPSHTLLVVRDESSTESLKSNLSFHRKHDPVTGLVNRVEFERQLIESIHDARVNHCTHGLCVIRLEQLKLVVDALGHLAGSELVKSYAAKLNDSIRSNDVLASLGNGEFALLLWQVDADTIKIAVEKLLKGVQHFDFSWDDQVFRVTSYIGVVEIDHAIDSWVQALNRADIASQHAEGHDTQLIFYSDVAESVRTYQNEVEWVGKIITAVRQNQFELYFQPIHSVNRSQLSHVEVLLRLRQGESVMAPAVFLQAAEKYNMIDIIDRWVLLTSFRWLSERRDIGIKHINLNISGISVARPEFCDYIHELVQRYLVPTEKICFEITETAAVNNLPQAINFINSMRALGCKVALDDFGTGMSSFSYLKNLPVDYLKIDGEFIKEIVSCRVSRSMVKAINEVAQEMGILTIAEFVESPEIMTSLAELGINYAQGYHIGKPEPLSGLYQQQNELAKESLRN
ncbi:MAG: EAL domain-containing protein [Gammaproteobacteria bacterium]|nr:EAL domain-containing protein [Gammaproteobacteria bacterium]